MDEWVKLMEEYTYTSCSLLSIVGLAVHHISSRISTCLNRIYILWFQKCMFYEVYACLMIAFEVHKRCVFDLMSNLKKERKWMSCTCFVLVPFCGNSVVGSLDVSTRSLKLLVSQLSELCLHFFLLRFLLLQMNTIECSLCMWKLMPFVFLTNLFCNPHFWSTLYTNLMNLPHVTAIKWTPWNDDGLARCTCKP